VHLVGFTIEICLLSFLILGCFCCLQFTADNLDSPVILMHTLNRMCGAQAYITSTWLVSNTIQVNLFSLLNMYAHYFCSMKA